MDRDLALSRGRMEPSARQVEGIAGFEDRVDRRLCRGGPTDGLTAVRPRLVARGESKTGSWMTQRFVPWIWRTKTSWTS